MNSKPVEPPRRGERESVNSEEFKGLRADDEGVETGSTACADEFLSVVGIFSGCEVRDGVLPHAVTDSAVFYAECS